MKKYSVLGKQIPALVIALLAMAGLGSAGLLSYYGMITGTATVEQSVKVDGKSVPDSLGISYDASGVAGYTDIDGPHSLTNDADVPATVSFETTQNDGDVEGITTRYYGTLALENKEDFGPDGAWSVIEGDGISGLLKYYLDGNEFTYEFEATGLQVSTAYSLIYYADKPDRFVNWGGNNPGALIAEGTTDTDGNLVLSGSVDLGMDLPSGDDANIDEYDYCASDGYDLCHGAKIWLVPSVDYNPDGNGDGDKLIAWNPSEYLFETDLISYHDADDGTGRIAYPGTQNFYIENTFDLALEPGTYTIETGIAPA